MGRSRRQLRTAAAMAVAVRHSTAKGVPVDDTVNDLA
jgi:hypothetical protein